MAQLIANNQQVDPATVRYNTIAFILVAVFMLVLMSLTAHCYCVIKAAGKKI